MKSKQARRARLQFSGKSTSASQGRERNSERHVLVAGQAADTTENRQQVPAELIQIAETAPQKQRLVSECVSDLEYGHSRALL